ncbi:hypothetical protein [Hyalangium sp.]|jgi:hypothetical protein|uniref:hypothetical protein n=1 Tax=Hyalangium sp. TaxID=2028555 RepID=UPI002D3B7033|nr:hypothetical protein [Hyalangium sp.]HYI02218.1 hypothetical protein [Hyalangium sp.]
MATFKEALQGLANATANLSSLQVFTYTGDVNSVLTKDGGGIDWDQLFTKSKANDGALKLVAATKVLFDGDTYNFQTSEKLDRLDALLEIHEKSVNNSRLARQSLIQFFMDGLKNAVK